MKLTPNSTARRRTAQPRDPSAVLRCHRRKYNTHGSETMTVNDQFTAQATSTLLAHSAQHRIIVTSFGTSPTTRSSTRISTFRLLGPAFRLWAKHKPDLWRLEAQDFGSQKFGFVVAASPGLAQAIRRLPIA